jgi:hypothetical protein
VDSKENNEHVEEDESKVGILILHSRWLPVTFVDYGCLNLENKKDIILISVMILKLIYAVW